MSVFRNFLHTNIALPTPWDHTHTPFFEGSYEGFSHRRGLHFAGSRAAVVLCMYIV